MYRVSASKQDPAITSLFNGAGKMFALYGRGDDLVRVGLITPLEDPTFDPDHWFLLFKWGKSREFETLEELAAWVNRRYS